MSRYWIGKSFLKALLGLLTSSDQFSRVIASGSPWQEPTRIISRTWMVRHPYGKSGTPPITPPTLNCRWFAENYQPKQVVGKAYPKKVIILSETKDLSPGKITLALQLFNYSVCGIGELLRRGQPALEGRLTWRPRRGSAHAMPHVMARRSNKNP